MSDDLLIHRDGGVLTLVFNRPDQLNALSANMVLAAAEEIEKSEDRVIVITGTGRAFCTGADVSGLDPSRVDGAVDAANRLITAVLSTGRPVVAAVNGPAAGVGCSLAVAADFTIARESAYFLLSFANIGLMPDGGATEIVAASIGRARAMRMAILAERLSAPVAAEIGLIHKAFGEEDYTDEVASLVATLVAGPTQSYARSKAAINASTLDSLEQAFAREREGQFALVKTEDFVEGVTGFLQKRAPKFLGR